MPSSYEYVLSLKDKVSGNLQKITGTSDMAMNKFSELYSKTQNVTASFKDFGNSVSSLRQKIDLLKAERDIIDPKDLKTIRQYNSEIKKLTKDVEKLETINGSRFKNWTKDAYNQIPSIAKNPLLLGAAAIGFAGKQAMSFDEGMAKINITAQLDNKARADLEKKIKKIAIDNKVDVGLAPVGFEKILSQLGNVEQSLPILDAALKGSKAGFVDVDIVAGALAQTMSIVGDQATAMDVLDTFFASKRVGAGEFPDFAKYMPNLIAGADNLGIKYKEVAGIFAYMTGKGQSAEKAAVLMENMFNVLGRGEIRKKLSLAGIDIFDDQGKIRSTIDIFTDLKNVTGSFSDEQRSSFLEKMGIVDKEAKNSISIMLGDIGKLKHSIDEVNNSAGETEKNLGFSRNAAQKASEVWVSLCNIGSQFGTIILPVINAGLFAATLVLDGLSAVLGGVAAAFSWWKDKLEEGNPWVWGLSVSIGLLTVAFAAHEIATNSLTLVTKAKFAVDSIVIGVTKVWTAVQWALNAAFLASPIGWIILTVGALVTAIMWAWKKFEGFRRVVYGTWETMKMFGSLLWDTIIGAVKNLIGGIGALGSALWKLLKGDFKGAAEDAANGAKKLFASTPIGATVDIVGKVKNTDWENAWEIGKQKGTESWQASQMPEGINDTNLPTVNAPVPEIPGPMKTKSYEELLRTLGSEKQMKDSSIKSVELDDRRIANLRGTTDYNAIVSKLQPKRIMQPIMAPIPLKNEVNVNKPDSQSLSTEIADNGNDNTDYNKSQENYLQMICGHVARIAATLVMPVAVAATPVTTLSVPENHPVINIIEPQRAAPVINIPESSPVLPAPIVNIVENISERTQFPDINIPEALPAQASAVVNTPESTQPITVIKLAAPPPVVLPQIISATTIPEVPAETARQEIFATTTPKRTTVEKVCDEIVINVQNGDAADAEQIADRVMEEIRKAIDNEA